MQILTELSKKEFDSMMRMDRKEIIEKMKQSGLTGRSGSNFLTGLKWEITMSAPGKKVLICNADEGEPGTFKDRFIMENNPSLLLQGIAIGSRVMDAECFIYLRGEYASIRKNIEKKISEMGLDIKIITGAGAYVCGEETALIESIEGHRGQPRSKPPYPTTHGLWGRPTCVNNVETLANVPLIIAGKWDPKLRLFSLSGNVSKPGIYEIPTGGKLSDIAKTAGAKNPKIVSLGYAGGLVPYEKFKDMIIDDKAFMQNSFFLGPCTMMFLDIDVTKALINISEFFVHESCGKCIPCREGGYRMMELIRKIDSGSAKKNDLAELEELSQYLDISFCPLGKSYGALVKNALKNFKDDFSRSLK